MAIREEKVIYFVRHRIQKNKSTGLFDCEITKHSKKMVEESAGSRLPLAGGFVRLQSIILS